MEKESKFIMEGKLKQGEALFTEGKIQKAEEYFLGLREQYPEDYEVLNNLGVTSFARGDQKAAEEYFLQALAVKDDYHDALMNLNTLYQDSKGWKVVERVMLQPDDGLYDIGFLTIWSQNCQKLYGERIREQCKTVYPVPMNKVDIYPFG